MFLGTAIGLLTWHAAPLVPSEGYDPSWYTAINWATEKGLAYGTQFIFTYGPLGFSERALATFGAPMALWSALYLAATNIGLGIVLVWAARRQLPLALAVAVAACASTLATELTPAIAFLLAGMALVDDDDGTPLRVLRVAGPVLAAIGLLAKLNDGVAVTTMVAIALVAIDHRRPRALLASAGIFGATFLVAWFASGQAFANLDDYVRGSYQVVSGYQVGLTAEAPQAGWDKAAAALLVALALAATVLTMRGRDPVRRAGLVALVAALCFLSAKQGFVRHDSFHVARFMAAMLLPWLVLPWSRSRRWAPLAAVAGVTLLSIPIAGGGIMRARWNLPSRADDSVHQLATFLLPGRREAATADARKSLGEFYGLPRNQLHQLRSGSVHVEPSEVSLAWGYALDWKPLPMFRSTAAYVPALDDRNAEALAGDEAPELILRHRDPGFHVRLRPSTFALDEHYLPWNSPAATLATFCHYRPISTTERYQVLRRAGDRCGRPRVLARVSTRYGERIRLPRPPKQGGVMLAEITGLEPTPLEQLKRVAYRADPRAIRLDRKPTYRFVPETAASGLVMGIPKPLDYPRPFRIAPNPKHITIEEGSPLNGGDGPVSVSFVFVPIT